MWRCLVAFVMGSESLRCVSKPGLKMLQTQWKTCSSTATVVSRKYLDKLRLQYGDTNKGCVLFLLLRRKKAFVSQQSCRTVKAASQAMVTESTTVWSHEAEKLTLTLTLIYERSPSDKQPKNAWVGVDHKLKMSKQQEGSTVRKPPYFWVTNKHYEYDMLDHWL